MVLQALHAQGTTLALTVEGTWLQLGLGVNAPRIDIEGTVAQWETLPDDLRLRRAHQIARLLAGGTPAALVTAASRPNAAPPGRGRGSSIAPLLILLLTVAGLGVSYRVLAPAGGTLARTLAELLGRNPRPESSAARLPDPDQERAELARAACAQTRARVARGANIGPSDVEGWQVELILLRRGAPVQLAAEPSLTRFFAAKAGKPGSTVIWPRASSLLAAQRFDAAVEVRALPALGSAHLSALSLVFSGPYVGPYFDESTRGDYLFLADALTDALHASDGALYARCGDSEPQANAIGSWFLGPTPGAAVGSLVFFMAGSNALPALSPKMLGSPPSLADRSHAFDIIQEAAASLDRSTTATLIGRELGMISGRSNQLSRLTFPFRDANRAFRASYEAARALGLAAR